MNESTALSLSVLIPVKNDADNLRECLPTVAFAAEIVVVDSASTDGTAQCAQAAGARVVQFEWNGNFPRKKNWALENMEWRHEWVLIVDADERITPELEREIRSAIQRKDVDGFYLNRRFWFLGGWINHCGYFPSWNLRLFKHRKGRYEKMEAGGGAGSGDNEVHEHVLLKGRAEYLAAPMEHYAFPDIATFVEKHIRYATWEAVVRGQFTSIGAERMRGSPFGNALQRRRWLKRVTLRMPFRPTLRFLYGYVVKQGYRDGYRGWVLCRLLAWYESLIVAKIWERRRERGMSAAT
ncbi:MAG: glycosyltransferase family 2 protein [Chthoniobacterales bacterium]|nr:glycosyltransferase family 2 protein [Chthoniobacterales bacterium]